MNAARLIVTTFATLALTAGWAASSFACDKDKAAATTAKRAKATTMISASAEGGACGFKTTMTAAELADHCATMKSTMTAAQMAEHCAAKKGTATAAAAGQDACAGKATAATAVAASAKGADCCAMKGASGKSARTAKATTAKKSPVFINAGNGASCGGTGMAGIAAAVLHDDCEACLDMSACSQSLDAAKANRQVVKLKNGIMLVYTADTPARISAVQAAVASRGEQHVRFAANGSKARLCGECTTIRDAITQGKLQREVNKIESGSFMLLTSSDPAVVAKLHGMTDLKAAARIKS